MKQPCTIRPCMLFPDVSSLNESQPTELRQPWIGWDFSLFQPNPGYGQSQPTELHQPMNWFSGMKTYWDVKTPGNNIRGRIVRGLNVQGSNLRGRIVPLPF
jgi:hypothetical protein